MALRYPKDMGTEWMKLKSSVKDAFTSANSRVPYQKIGAGVVQIFSSLTVAAGAWFQFTFANNQLGMFIGRHYTGGEPADGLFIRRVDGSLAFWSFTKTETGFGYTAIYDRLGNIILSDDAVKEQGMARPWLPWNYVNWSELVSPPSNRQATSGTEANIILLHTNSQHGKVRGVGYVSAPTGTAEVKFYSYPDDTLIYSFTQADGWTDFLDFDLPSWQFGDNVYIRVSIRRASGTGNVGFTLVSFMGRQS